MIRQPPISTRTYTLFPCPTLFRSEQDACIRHDVGIARFNLEHRIAARTAATEITAAGAEIGFQIVDYGIGRRRAPTQPRRRIRSEGHTHELTSLMRTQYAGLCLKKKKKNTTQTSTINTQHQH